MHWGLDGAGVYSSEYELNRARQSYLTSGNDLEGLEESRGGKELGLDSEVTVCAFATVCNWKPPIREILEKRYDGE